MANEVDEFKTCDLYLAASIQASGYKMTKHTQDRERVYFHYDNNGDLVSRVTQEYLAHRLEVDALLLVDNIRSLKSLCAEIKKSLNKRRTGAPYLSC